MFIRFLVVAIPTGSSLGRLNQTVDGFDKTIGKLAVKPGSRFHPNGF